MRIKVSVTKGDINHKWNYKDTVRGNCPVALAVSRTIGELTGADIRTIASYLQIVGRELGDSSYSLHDRLFTSPTPRSAVRFMKTYDQHQTGKPFNFFLNV